MRHGFQIMICVRKDDSISPKFRRCPGVPSQSEFRQKVFAVVRRIPTGSVATYGQVAFLVGSPQCTRMVGQALHHAPDQADLPCHRVVNAAGRLVPGWTEQRSLLESEGVAFKENGCVNLKHCLWRMN